MTHKTPFRDFVLLKEDKSINDYNSIKRLKKIRLRGGYNEPKVNENKDRGISAQKSRG